MVERAERSVAVADRRAAFAVLVDRQLARAYRLAGVILGDATDAEDATHDAFVAAWRAYGGLRDANRFEAWFGRILVNVCRDRLRRQKRIRVVNLDVANALGAGDTVRATDDRLVLDRAFAQLSPDQRVVVALRYWADLSVDDIADRVGVPPGTVKSRLHTAIGRLHAALAADSEGVR
jgi:RNA polymerase sigma-70 factor (ECF subfamily)